MVSVTEESYEQTDGPHSNRRDETLHHSGLALGISSALNLHAESSIDATVDRNLSQLLKEADLSISPEDFQSRPRIEETEEKEEESITQNESNEGFPR